MKNSQWAIALIFFCGMKAAVAAAGPEEVLQSAYPKLHELYVESQTYASGFREYASRQGFRQPFENLATVVHEMIHVASAVHAGYFIDGVYYEPYVSSGAWPRLTNKDVQPLMQLEERGIIYRVYMPSTQGNNLGNVLDEINAYSHVAEFVCKNEPGSGGKQVANLIGHLHLQEAYLRVARMTRPAEYKMMSESRAARGAIRTLFERAVRGLRACDVPDISIPRKEALYFISLEAARLPRN